ncbi:MULTISPECIES: replication terminator protein [unclassified Clostridium]|uniref:replication terminator protein n=1 Tax=unclassified Clostridium TaxID=2614128 RepID=UPI001EEE7C7B|nr:MULTISPECIES: replication terminator protein [unclassified Clostridium]
MENMINLEQFADGAFAEKVNIGLKEVLANITDPNTDWKKKRKLTIELTFSAREDRELTAVDIIAKPKLEPAKPLSTTIVMGTDGKGGIMASEFKKQIPGQSVMRVDEETGEVLTTAEEREPINLEGIKLVK